MTDDQGLELACAAAKQAGDLLLRRRLEGAQVISETGRDIKLREDRDAELVIREVLARTGFPVLGEETGGTLTTDGPVWIVDPLDGTYNYRRGSDAFAVSIALYEDCRPRLGVVNEVAAGRLYRGLVGKGAWCNDHLIHVSAISLPHQAALVTGLPVNRDYGADALLPFLQSFQRYRKVRMLGAASLSLAMVAAGIFDVYHEDDIMLWDVAAGLALVEAAGGCVRVTASAASPMARRVAAGACAALLPS